MSDRMEQLYQTAVAGGLISNEDVEGKLRESFPVIFVAPLGSVLPDDGQLSYKTFDKFGEILDFEVGTVILFREDQARLLGVLCIDSDVFERNVHALYGIPGADYGRWFEEVTFGKARVSYGPLVSEIRTSNEVAAARAANETKTVAEREDARVLTSKGKVRTYDEDSIGLASE